MEETLKSYRGVFIDINKSDICSLKYGLYFYFCSEGMKEKFNKNVEEYVNNMKERIKKVYLPTANLINIELVFAIEYYRKHVEKRGFRIETLHGAKVKNVHIIGDVEFDDIEK